ncbi:hypothetical protein IMSAGC011_00096 [Lachnospiraceae bacterium]|nr:hypothetical protein IMSAGC011_00096 [Lachnospiraceae bacterium]
MNYQQAIVAAIRQILFRSVAVDAVATTVLAAGFGFLSFCLAAVAAIVDLVASAFLTTAVDVAVDAKATTADAAAGSGFSFCFAAVAVVMAADADAANNLIPEGPFYTDPHNLYEFYFEAYHRCA